MIQQARQTEEAPIYVTAQSVSKKHLRTRDWRDHLNPVFRMKCGCDLKRSLADILDQNKVYSLLSLCMRAGKVKSGEFAVLEAIRKKTARLVIVAEDASDNTRKKFSDKCKYYEIPMVVFGNKDSLGHAIGKDVRTSLAITDFGLSESLRKNLLVEELDGGNVNGEN